MSGRLIRLFHASPKGLSNIFNPMFSNENTIYSGTEIHLPWEMFENTEFIGKTPNDPIQILSVMDIFTLKHCKICEQNVVQPRKCWRPSRDA